jgi:hypothetical protein
LRCIPNGKQVSELLFKVWQEQHQAEKIVTGVSAPRPANDSHSSAPQGAMA